MAAAKPHVLIIGAGLGGLFLAQILRKKGVSFEIFESGSAERDEASLWPKAITLHRFVVGQAPGPPSFQLYAD